MDENSVEIMFKHRRSWLMPLVKSNPLMGHTLPIIIKTQRLSENNTNAIVTIKNSFLKEFQHLKGQLKSLELPPSVQTHTLKLLQHWVAHKLPLLNTTSDTASNEKQLYQLLQSSAQKESLKSTLKLSYLLVQLYRPSKEQESHFQTLKTLLNQSVDFETISLPKPKKTPHALYGTYTVKVWLMSLLLIGLMITTLFVQPINLLSLL
ncbi:MAG TPA: hypothetical protein QF353_01380 [Gammaproteobacteria bacterium]|nr:hypothetical protein [Gammaproteobacteria bacterium]